MQVKKLICAAISFFLLMCGTALAQEKITLNLKGVTLREALAAVEKNSNYSFFYDAQNVDTNARISANVKGADIEQTVKTILEGTGITYTLYDQRPPDSSYLTRKGQPESRETYSDRKSRGCVRTRDCRRRSN